MRKTMYQSQRQPWRAAMLLRRRKVPLRMSPVSLNASFCATCHKRVECVQSRIDTPCWQAV